MKKFIVIGLSLVMCMSIFIVSASAIEDKPFYLVLGDSIAYGSGLGNAVPVITTQGTDISVPSFFTAFPDIYDFIFSFPGAVYSFVTSLIA